MEDQLTEMERFMRNIRGKEYEQHDQDTQALQEAATSNREYFGREAILEQQQINSDNQHQFDMFKKVLTECVGNLYIASLIIDTPELYHDSLHEAVSTELNTLWLGCNTSKDIFTLHETASDYIQEAMILAESISCGTLQEGIGANIVAKLKTIKDKVKKNMAENNEKRIARLAKEKSDKRIAAYETGHAKQVAGAKYVSEEDLIKERNDFKKSFFRILNRYPKLKANMDKDSAEIYCDEFTPLYDYNEVYCDIEGDGGGDAVSMSEEFEKLFDRFNDELTAIDLKYHFLNMEYQCSYYFYQLYNDGDFTIVDPSSTIHENIGSDALDKIKSIKTNLQAKIKQYEDDREIKKKSNSDTKSIADAIYVPKSILIKEASDFRQIFKQVLNKYPKLKANFHNDWAKVRIAIYEPIYDYSEIYGDIHDINKEPNEVSNKLNELYINLHHELKLLSDKLLYHKLNIEGEYQYYVYCLYSSKYVTTINSNSIHEGAVEPMLDAQTVVLTIDEIDRINNFEEVNGKESIGQQIQNRVVDVYKAEEEAGRERKERAQAIINTTGGVLTEGAIVSGMDTFSDTPSTIFHAIFNNRCKQTLNESAGCNSNTNVLADTITMYTLLECFNGLGLTNMTRKDEEKLIEEINLA
jgi:hypothetical protein